ncbi:MAG: VOC family protein [Gammaproteobacteria bacterium]|nr:VOC family protein [Gammaproteobacteria bacterium]
MTAGSEPTAGRAGPVKRVTLWVRDVEAALRVYRDALGLQVIEDKSLASPGIARMVGLSEASLRIVHLAAPGHDHGWIGLYAISDTQPAPMQALPRPEGFPRYGQATIVLGVQDMPAIVGRLRATPEVQFITEPTEYRKTSAGDATPPGLYREVIFFDPDGIPVSLMEFVPG